MQSLRFKMASIQNTIKLYQKNKPVQKLKNQTRQVTNLNVSILNTLERPQGDCIVFTGNPGVLYNTFPIAFTFSAK